MQPNMKARNSRLFFKITQSFILNHKMSSRFLPLPPPRFYTLKVGEHDFLGRRTRDVALGLSWRTQVGRLVGGGRELLQYYYSTALRPSVGKQE